MSRDKVISNIVQFTASWVSCVYMQVGLADMRSISVRQIDRCSNKLWDDWDITQFQTFGIIRYVTLRRLQQTVLRRRRAGKELLEKHEQSCCFAYQTFAF